jgi:tRNA pseudouridine55 synthase
MVDKREILRAWLQERVIEDGLIEVYKPYGVPSTALTEMYKRVTGLKVGHGGTLDPLAEGSMMLGIGKGTKLLTKHLASEKRYRTTMLFGAQTFSGDLELPLEIAEQNSVPEFEAISTILEELSKGYMQDVPVLSAVKHHGKTSYELVRAGRVVEKKSVETRLLEWKLFEYQALNSSKLSQVLEDTASRLEMSVNEFAEIGESVGYHAKKYVFMLEKWLNSLEASKANVLNMVEKQYALLDIEVLVPKGMYIRSLVQDIAGRMDQVGVIMTLQRQGQPR